jgi:hypothetical protein
MSKKSIKKFAFTYPQSKCVYIVLPKTNTFYDLCKRKKIVRWNALFSAPNLSFYTHHTTHWFIVKRLCGHVARAKFSFLIFLTFLNLSNMYFKIKKAYAPRSQNTTPHIITIRAEPVTSVVTLSFNYSRNVTRVKHTP